MYSRNYGYIGNDKDRDQGDSQIFGSDAADKKREIPVETFHDKIGEAEFQRMYTAPSFQQEHFAVPEPPPRRPEEPACSSCPTKPGITDKKGPFGFLDGLFNNFNLDDIIIVALIVLFMWDDDKSNDIMMPILLFILLAF